MQKSINYLIAAVCLLSLGYLLYKDFSAKDLVYVDAGRLLDGYKGMAKARQDFEGKAKAWQSNIDTLESELKSSILEYERKSPSMTANERRLSGELLKTKQEQLAQYRQAIQQKAQEEDQKLTQSVISEVNAYIKSYGEKKGYRIILAATQMGNIAYAHEDLDITEEVLKGLNEGK